MNSLEIEIGVGPIGYVLAQATRARAFFGEGSASRSDEIKHILRERHNLTLKDFAQQYGFHYVTVSHVVRGINKATWGNGRSVADKLADLTGIRP